MREQSINSNLAGNSSLSEKGLEDEVVNRVSNSSLVTLDLEQLHDSNPRTLLDIKDWLYQGIILKEKQFREHIKSNNWAQYKNHNVAITCSTDAIIPTWAFMLVAVSLQPYVNKQIFGSLVELETQLYLIALDKIDWQKYKQAKVVIKGCSKVEVPIAIYVDAIARLRPLSASIMFGEPCSTVPLFKKRN